MKILILGCIVAMATSLGGMAAEARGHHGHHHGHKHHGHRHHGHGDRHHHAGIRFLCNPDYKSCRPYRD